jgi:hypothetical protein
MTDRKRVADSNTPQKSVAKATEQRQEPVAWAVMYPNGKGVEEVFECEADARDDASHDQEIVPLYRQPQTCPYVVGRTTLHCSLTPFTLTDDERAAVQWFAHYGLPERYAAALRPLLERTK